MCVCVENERYKGLKMKEDSRSGFYEHFRIIDVLLFLIDMYVGLSIVYYVFFNEADRLLLVVFPLAND